MIVGKGHAHRQMDQNREPRNKSLHMHLNDFQQGCQNHPMEKGHFYFQQMGWKN